MSIEIGSISDERIAGFANSKQEGFANWAIMWDEVRALAAEVQYYRTKPLHCPNCDGNHL
jgi:hypothetical protein